MKKIVKHLVFVFFCILFSAKAFSQEIDFREYLGQEIGSLPYAFEKRNLPNEEYNYFEVRNPCYFLGLPFSHLAIRTDKDNIINRGSFNVKKKITKELFDTLNKKYGTPYRILAADTLQVIHNEYENSTSTKLIDVTTYNENIVTLKYRSNSVHINFDFAFNTMSAEFKYVKE
ncbi:hypothetical protein M0D21_07930 [Aquimarina sp. D1M17]|uniref:hypothetical protein n=1 Tax=Aquimarina acroporae TaxID=2937283 RepID=UPI0020BD9499|nr:hypothetical protein [Aquimarina acroporae]MCK8521492.1 hypothetical protein [Aquimarina acroporae]